MRPPYPPWRFATRSGRSAGQLWSCVALRPGLDLALVALSVAFPAEAGVRHRAAWHDWFTHREGLLRTALGPSFSRPTYRLPTIGGLSRSVVSRWPVDHVGHPPVACLFQRLMTRTFPATGEDAYIRQPRA